MKHYFANYTQPLAAIIIFGQLPNAKATIINNFSKKIKQGKYQK